MKEFFIDCKDNTAYMQGFVSGRKATGMDWARLRMAVEEAKEKYSEVCKGYERQIRELERQKSELELEIIRRDSEIEALKIAWRHRNDGK